MKKILPILAILATFSFSTLAKAEPAHFVAWGDEEGIVKRPGDDIKEKNPVMPILMKQLLELDKKNKIDALLHVGDFVRFDPDETYYKTFLGIFLDKFYPTTGGDQEFYLGRYGRFINAVPHLKFLYLDRATKDGNGLEYYYHTIVKDTHLISLYSPDEYREVEKHPEYNGQNFFANTNSVQYKWLENLLINIRTLSKDDRPIIILAHGPIFNGSKLLVELFSKYKVNLVLNGDVHVLANKEYKGTKYFITGIAGDTYAGGCEYINVKDANYIEEYESCYPKKDFPRLKGEPFKFNYDHYLDIVIDKNKVMVKVIDIETGKEIKL